MPAAARARRVPPRARGGVGVALAGGGLLGAAYELGALAALDEAMDGLDLTALDACVGVSAGAFIAAGLAHGRTPRQMVRLFIEDAEAALDPAAVLGPSARLWRRLGAAAPGMLRAALQAAALARARGSTDTALDALERVARSLPIGLFDPSPFERALERLFSQQPGGNDFRRLGTQLRIVATDLDRGCAVEFGAPGLDAVPISRAVIASAAVPGVFAPVSIGGRDYVDGALTKTLHASVALDQGVSLLFCINPLIPFSGSPGARPGMIARAGLPTILSQSFRTMIRSRMSTGLEKYRVTHPRATLVVLEPRADDAALFFTRIFTIAARRRVCEQAYQHTRQDLLRRASELAPALAAHGLRLNTAVLRNPQLRLVDFSRPALTAPRGSLADAVTSLGKTVGDIEHALRLHRSTPAGQDTPARATPPRGARQPARGAARA